MRETIASRGRPLSSAVRTDLLHLARATSSLQLPDQIGTPSAEAGVHAAAAHEGGAREGPEIIHPINRCICVHTFGRDWKVFV